MNHRVVASDASSGGWLWCCGREGSGDGELKGPRDLTLSRCGRELSVRRKKFRRVRKVKVRRTKSLARKVATLSRRIARSAPELKFYPEDVMSPATFEGTEIGRRVLEDEGTLVVSAPRPAVRDVGVVRGATARQRSAAEVLLFGRCWRRRGRGHACGFLSIVDGSAVATRRPACQPVVRKKR